MVLGLAMGSSGAGFESLTKFLSGKSSEDPMVSMIIWNIRFPRVLLAVLVGAALSLGGLVFQAILRNPLAEPYILGISGGAAVGAIIGILAGFSRFPGVSLTAFTGSMITLFLIIVMSSRQTILNKESLLLSGVMVNAFCTAGILFLVSMTQDSRLHNIMFWLMGDLSTARMNQILILVAVLTPCFILLFALSHAMNLLLMGREMAKTMGVHDRAITMTLLIVTSLMISVTVSQCGILGFVGLVIPHIFRLLFGPDHRILVPACIMGGGAYMVWCDLLARVLPKQGEMPVGVITAMIGAPLFIFLLKKTER